MNAIQKLFSTENRNEINYSDQYDQFKFRSDNRPLNVSHVFALTRSIKENGLQKPITVDENLVILDGQHRFTALKNLGHQIAYFTANSKMTNIIEMNTVRRNWQLADYLNHYFQKEVNSYVKIMSLVDEFQGFSVPAIVKAVGCTPAAFKKGQLQVDETNYITAERILSGCNDMTWFSGRTATSFIAALAQINRIELFDLDKFFEKADHYKSSKIYHCGSRSEYLRMIETLWNFKQPQNKKIKL